MKIDTLIDLDWLAYQTGLPVDFLIAIPIFIAVVMTLVSMAATKPPENYRVGRHLEIDRTLERFTALALLLLVGIAITGLNHYFLKL